MILSSGSIRFTRLDRFDDVQEAQSPAGLQLGGRLFASCWVKGEAEDIPQWAMYGDRMAGVRVSLPDDPFDWEVISDRRTVPGTDAKWEFNDVLSPFTLRDVFGDGYLLPPPIGGREQFMIEVDYVPDVAAAYNRHVQVNGGHYVIRPHPSLLAGYKSNKWSFQREHRFVLWALPGPRWMDDPEAYGVEYLRLVADPTWGTAPVGVPYIDLRLGRGALENALIRLGPLASAADRVIVESLLARFAPSARLEVSELTGTIRPKGTG